MVRLRFVDSKIDGTEIIGEPCDLKLLCMVDTKLERGIRHEKINVATGMSSPRGRLRNPDIVLDVTIKESDLVWIFKPWLSSGGTGNMRSLYRVPTVFAFAAHGLLSRLKELTSHSHSTLS